MPESINGKSSIAITQEKGCETEGGREEMDPSLDCCSSSFDPVKALDPRYSHRVVLPVPRVRALDNLSKFIGFLKRSSSSSSGGKGSKEGNAGGGKTVLQEKKDQERVIDNNSNMKTKGRHGEEKKELITDQQAKTQIVPPSKKCQNVMHRMMSEESQQGPISVLYKAMGSRKRVTIRVRPVRRSPAPQSSCCGVVKSFDKHFNVLLADVQETYIEMFYKPKVLLEDLRRHKETCSGACAAGRVAQMREKGKEQSRSTSTSKEKINPDPALPLLHNDMKQSPEHGSTPIPPSLLLPTKSNRSRPRRCNVYKRMCKLYRTSESVLTPRVSKRNVKQMMIRGDTICSVILQS
eukprot:Nk52_evm68s1992 gene=Nk52_evmTU68s1992